MSDAIREVAVVGAGPAGSICALELARRGHDVLLLDRENFPRDKACGDVLIPDALDVLRRVGLYDTVVEHARLMRKIRVYSPSQIEFDVPGDFVGLRRYKFDAILQQTAVAAGAEFRQASVCSLVRNAGGSVELGDTERRVVRARYVVLATGGNVDLALKTRLVSRAEPSAVAIRAYYRSPLGLDHLILSYDKEMLPGYGWIIPVAEDIYNVGCGITLSNKHNGHHNLKRLLGRFLETFPPAIDMMRDAKKLSPISGAGLRTAFSGTESVVDGPVIGIGETVGTTYPFTGEGIGKAMRTGEILAPILSRTIATGDRSHLDDYPRQITAELKPRYAAYLQAERWLGRAWLNDFVARRIRHSRSLQKALSDFVAESARPNAIYSPWSILRSFWT